MPRRATTCSGATPQPRCWSRGNYSSIGAVLHRAKDLRGWILSAGESGRDTHPCATAAIPPIAVNRRAEIPTQAFQAFLQGLRRARAAACDSLGRREIMAGYSARVRSRPGNMRGLRRIPATHEQFLLSVGPLQNGFILGR